MLSVSCSGGVRGESLVFTSRGTFLWISRGGIALTEDWMTVLRRESSMLVDSGHESAVSGCGFGSEEAAWLDAEAEVESGTNVFLDPPMSSLEGSGIVLLEAEIVFTVFSKLSFRIAR